MSDNGLSTNAPVPVPALRHASPPRAFSRVDLERSARTCLHKGRWCNADCWLVEQNGSRWVVKDFSAVPLPLRWTAGAWLARHEQHMLQKVAGLGLAPGDPWLVDRLALAARFVEGRPLKCFAAGELPAAFFERLEKRVRAMHSRRVAHLDLRNAANILVTPAHEPVLLDFQSALNTAHLPAALRALLEKIDLSGIYKHWAKVAPNSLGEERERLLLWQLRLRKWWRLRGYQGMAVRQRKLKDFELALLRKYSS